MSGFKEIFLEKIEPDIKVGKIKSILELGCGLSTSILTTLRKYPNLKYVGVEPSEPHAALAQKNLRSFPQAKIINTLGYSMADEYWGQFDLVISLSVLEHVKQLDKFLKNSVDASRIGGRIIHRWDLGHALQPSSLRERIQVAIGNMAPVLLPEHKFVRMLAPHVVVNKMKSLGVKIEKVTYHQMPDHKSLLKRADLPSNLSREIIEWEFKASSYLDSLDEKVRLKLFPTVAVWSIKE